MCSIWLSNMLQNGDEKIAALTEDSEQEDAETSAFALF